MFDVSYHEGPLPPATPRPSHARTRGASQGLSLPGAAATICRVSRQTIYGWINERRVERLIDALRLARASGVAIENLAGDDVEKLAVPLKHHVQSAGKKDLTRFSGSLSHDVIGERS